MCLLVPPEAIWLPSSQANGRYQPNKPTGVENINKIQKQPNTPLHYAETQNISYLNQIQNDIKNQNVVCLSAGVRSFTLFCLGTLDTSHALLPSFKIDFLGPVPLISRSSLSSFNLSIWDLHAHGSYAFFETLFSVFGKGEVLSLNGSMLECLKTPFPSW